MGGSSSAQRRVPGGWIAELVGLVVGSAALAGTRAFVGTGFDAAGFLLIPAILLVSGVFAGRMAERLRLPRLTGYILYGVAVGPFVLGFVGAAQVAQVKLVNDLAIGLIALMAGAEIRAGWLRARIGQVLAITGTELLVLPPVILALLLGLAGLYPFLADAAAAGLPTWVVALLVGAILVANSPMVVISVIKDLRAKGPVTEVAMGVVIVKDVMVILLFTVMITLITSLQYHTEGSGTIAELVAHSGGRTLLYLLASLVVGIPIGLGLAWATESGMRRVGWLVVGIALAVAVLEPLLHIKPLFCLLAAGFAAENLWPKRSAAGSHRLEAALGAVAMPVFVIFFVATGLGLDLHALAEGWIAVLLLAAVRLGTIWFAVTAATRALRAEPAVTSYGWAAMIPQAGMTLGLAAIVGGQFPGWGEGLATVLVACVALHELFGPVLLGWALKRSGEAGRAQEA